MRVAAGGVLLLIASYVMFDAVTNGILQGTRPFHIVTLNLLLGIGIILVGIMVLKSQHLF
ncbi:MAG: hypothetical protein ACUVQ8_03670 [Nitrososphaeria archaeon]